MTISKSDKQIFRLSMLALAMSCSLSSLAQPIDTTGQQSDSALTDSMVVYPAAFFSQYSPVSVNDMIDRIPGVSIGGGSGGRGLGTGGGLLINGQRLAGKANAPLDQLARIAARQVERIEIIRGNNPELDVRSSGQIVNVVLNESANRPSLSVEANMDSHRDGTLAPGGSLSYGGRSNGFDYLFNVMADPAYNHDERSETGYYPDLSIKDTTEEDTVRDQTAYQMTMNMGYDFGNDRVQLNTRIADSSHPTDITRRITDFSGFAPTSRLESEQLDYVNENWEVGGDYEHTFADSSRFSMVFVVNNEIRDYVQERFSHNTQSLDKSLDKSLYVASNRRTRERIVQGSYSWRLGESQDMQLGLERAQTILDSSLFVGQPRANQPTSPFYGNLVPIPSSSNPGSTVEEMRYEGFAVHNWTLNDRMSLESSMVYETSVIEQSGTSSRSRDFAFLRPKLDYRFDITSSLQLRASIERLVSQLSFTHFTASANTSDTDKTVNAGNPDLVQEKEIRYELNLEYRLPNDAGVLSSRFFFRDLEDVIGRVDVSPSPDNPVSAAGNIGDGIRYGVYLDASTRLGFLGLPDAILTTGLNIYDSRVTNPFLGSDIRLNNRGRALIGFRHDLPSMSLNYGFTYSSEFTGGQKTVDIDTIEQTTPQPSLSLFISKVAFDDVTFRLESNNTLSNDSCRQRLRYDGFTAANVLEEIEKSCNGSGQKIALKIRTTF